MLLDACEKMLRGALSAVTVVTVVTDALSRYSAAQTLSAAPQHHPHPRRLPQVIATVDDEAVEFSDLFSAEKAPLLLPAEAGLYGRTKTRPRIRTYNLTRRKVKWHPQL